MNDPAKTIRGRMPSGEIVTATMAKPVASPEGPEWICSIHCPTLFKTDKSVAGVDADLALELAEILVTQLFAHHEIELI